MPKTTLTFSAQRPELKSKSNINESTCTLLLLDGAQPLCSKKKLFGTS